MNIATSPQLNGAHFNVCIIGAGIAGLSAAHSLSGKGLNIAVLEKSRGPGGRMATRRINDAQFNHGAPSFTVESEAFLAWAQSVERNGCSKMPVIRASSGISHATNSANSSMNAVARSAFAPEHFYTLIRVTAIKKLSSAQWQIEYNQETPQAEVIATGQLTADNIVLALPAPQAAALLTPLPTPFTAIARLAEGVAYDACWVAMFTLANSSGIAINDLDEAAIGHSAALSKCVRQAGLDGTTTENWVLHATAAWTNAHLNDTKEMAAEALFSAFSEHFRISEKPAFCTAHRWLYSQPTVSNTLQAGHAAALKEATTQGLCCVGDWVYCEGVTPAMSNVERAWLSGQFLKNYF